MRLIPALAAATLAAFVANTTVYADPAPQAGTDSQANDKMSSTKKMTKKQMSAMKKKQMMMKKDGM